MLRITLELLEHPNYSHPIAGQYHLSLLKSANLTTPFPLSPFVPSNYYGIVTQVLALKLMPRGTVSRTVGFPIDWNEEVVERKRKGLLFPRYLGVVQWTV